MEDFENNYFWKKLIIQDVYGSKQYHHKNEKRAGDLQNNKENNFSNKIKLLTNYLREKDGTSIKNLIIK